MYDPRKFGAKCDECPFKECKPVTPQYRSKASLAIVGDYPSDTEVEVNKPFTGKLGMVVRASSAMVGANWHEVHLTHAILCKPPGRKPLPKELKEAAECCAPRLQTEFGPKHQVRSIVAIGQKALAAFTQYTQPKQVWGAPIPISENRAVFASPWPSQKFVRNHDIILQRARLYALGDPLEYNWGEIHIEPNEETYNALCQIHASGLPIAFDTETKGMDPLRSEIMCLSFATKDLAVSIPWKGYDSKRFGYSPAIETYEWGEKLRTKALEILADPKTLVIMHNCQHDILALEYQGLPFKARPADTLLMHHTLYAEMAHGLQQVVCQYFYCPPWKTLFGDASDEKGAEKFIQRDPLVLRDYNAKDSLMSARVYHKLWDELTLMPQGVEIYHDYLDCSMIAMRMRKAGALVDTGALQTHRRPLVEKIEEARVALLEIAAPFGEINFGSPKQLQKLFFGTLKCKPTSYSKITQEPSVDASFLQSLTMGDNPFVAELATRLLNLREAEKILSTYIDGLPIQSDGRVHSEWKVFGTVSGRWASKAPNLQNVPKNLRDLFKAAPGNWVVSADYAALELRIVALLAKDMDLIDAFMQDLDMHTKTAMAMFKLPSEKDVNKKTHRQMAKSVAYGFNYNSSDDVTAVYAQIKKTFPEVQRSDVEWFRKVWFQLHPRIALWQARTIMMATKLKYVEDALSGRRRSFPDGHVDANEVLNFPAQSFAGTMMNRALKGIDADLDWSTESIIAQVHDAAYIETPDPLRGADILQKNMAMTITIDGVSLDFTIDIDIGTNMKNGKPYSAYQKVAGRMTVEEWFNTSNKEGLFS